MTNAPITAHDSTENETRMVPMAPSSSKLAKRRRAKRTAMGIQQLQLGPQFPEKRKQRIQPPGFKGG